MLLFKKKFLDAIRSGTKRQTLRVAKFARMRTGQRSYIPGIGYIWITAVEQVELNELTPDDALLDGFESLAELHHELAAIYGDRLQSGEHLFRIRFELAPGEKKRERPKS